MPTVTCSYADLTRLIKRKVPMETLQERLPLIKCEVESIENELITLEVNSDRPDLLSAEGIARELRGYLGYEKGPRLYKRGKSDVVVTVEERVKKVRPSIRCAVVRNVQLDDEAIRQVMQLQEKLHLTHCRRRIKASIGVHDIAKINHKIIYTASQPEKIRFTPLYETKEMDGREILTVTEKGKEYGYIIQDSQEFPILKDVDGKVLALPPIINGTVTQLTRDTRDIFIDVTGTDDRLTSFVLNIVATSLAERGQRIDSVKIIDKTKSIISPDLDPKKMLLHIEGANRVIGLKLKPKEMSELLRKMRYGTTLTSPSKINVLMPPYRADILHEIDLVEDVAIGYGYNKLEPELPMTASVGRELEKTKFTRKIRDLMVGLAFQEVLSYVFTNKTLLFEQMGVDEEQVVEVKNPLTTEYSVLRSWLLPGLMDFLSRNRHVPYPQRVFECGDAVNLNESFPTKVEMRRKLAGIICDAGTSYEDAQASAYCLLNNIGLTRWNTEPTSHSTFIPGRVASIMIDGKEIGFLGEIHPRILTNFQLENPAAAFELDLHSIMRLSA